MSAKEIDELLKRGAYDVFREDDSDQQEFEEADIDSILERRARKVIKCDSLRGYKLYCALQHCTVLYCSVMYCIVLCCIVEGCTILIIGL
jgi:hypothetical protein